MFSSRSRAQHKHAICAYDLKTDCDRRSKTSIFSMEHNDTNRAGSGDKTVIKTTRPNDDGATLTDDDVARPAPCLVITPERKHVAAGCAGGRFIRAQQRSGESSCESFALTLCWRRPGGEHNGQDDALMIAQRTATPVAPALTKPIFVFADDDSAAIYDDGSVLSLCALSLALLFFLVVFRFSRMCER